MRAVQARLSANDLADTVEKLFDVDFDIETQYHTMLNGKWNHIMDQASGDLLGGPVDKGH